MGEREEGADEEEQEEDEEGSEDDGDMEDEEDEEIVYGEFDAGEIEEKPKVPSFPPCPLSFIRLIDSVFCCRLWARPRLSTCSRRCTRSPNISRSTTRETA